MNRRCLISVAASMSAAAALPVGAIAAQSGPGLLDDLPYKPGEQYQVLPVPVAPEDPSRIEVVEVFSYMCVHCFNFDDAVTAWAEQLPDDVVFRRSPAIFSAQWKTLAQAFYTAQALQVSEAVHKPLFRAIHLRRENIANRVALAKLFAEHGVAPEDFDKVWDSFGVRAAVQQADARTRAWGVTGVPQLIVNGKYRLDGRLVGGNVNMLPAADYLIDFERRRRESAA